MRLLRSHEPLFPLFALRGLVGEMLGISAKIRPVEAAEGELAGDALECPGFPLFLSLGLIDLPILLGAEIGSPYTPQTDLARSQWDDQPLLVILVLWHQVDF